MLGTEGTGAPGFEQAFDELAPRAFALALKLVGNREDAEDIAAEALARTLAAWGRIGDRPWRDGWVLRVTANVAVDLIRRRRPSELMADLPTDVLDVEERISVRAAVGLLPKRQREVLVLRYFADLHDEDIAAALKISVGSVKKHAARGLAGARRRLGAENKEMNLAW